MFQNFKRAKFLATNNFQYLDTGDCLRMHVWLQEKNWPANEFVDLFIRAYPNFDPVTNGLSFKFFMINQYEWVSKKSDKDLCELVKRIDQPKFSEVDQKGIIPWAKKILAEIKV